MVRFISDSTEELRTSRSYLRDWYNYDKKAQHSPDKLDLVFEMYTGDPVISAAVNITVDSVNGSGYRFVTKKGEKQNMRAVNQLLERFDELSMSRLLRNLTYNLLIYGDAFLELVWKNGRVKEAYVLDTPTIEPRVTEKGELLGYVQAVGGKPKVYFSPDECLHFRFIEIGTRVWGFTPLKPLMTTLATKNYAETDNRTRFQNNAPRGLWIAKTGNDKQIKQLISNLKAAKEQPHKDIVIQGEIEYSPLNKTNDEQEHLELLKYIREQVLMAMQVPPIMIGLPDNSNRSNSETQLSAYQRRISSLQHTLEYTVNRNLIPLLGNFNLNFKFYPFDKRNEKDDMEIAKGLYDMGLDEESLKLFLYESGIRLRNGATFKRQAPPNFGGQLSGLKERKDAPPKHDTGQDSETRPEQLRSEGDFGSYPYVMEALE